MHANTDEDGFVKNMTFTPGNVHDSQEFDELLDINKSKDKLKVGGQVYADSAYANKLNDKKLGKHNNKILHRANHLHNSKSKTTSSAHRFAML